MRRNQKVRQRVNFTDQWLIDKSIKFIKDNAPEEGYYLAFSGGKDSIVLYDLAKKSGVKLFPFYSCVGIDPPSLVKFIKQNYPEVKFIKPKISFYHILENIGPPSIFKRWCCAKLKETSLKIIPLKHRLVGIRAEESSKRRKRPAINKMANSKQILYKPLYDWNEYNIWNYIEENNLKYPSLYDEGFNRIGCVICPFLSYKQKMINKELYPKIYRVFENSAKKHFYEKNKTMYASQTFEEWLEYWYKNSYFKSNKEI